MQLRNKIFLAIGLIWVSFLIITYAGSSIYLIHSYLTLEQEHANEDLNRVDEELAEINSSLYTFTFDWSHWTDLYKYMQGTNPAFIPNNLNMAAFINSNINFVTYWDKKEKLVFGTAANLKTHTWTAFPAGIENYIYPGSILLQLPLKLENVQDYMLLPSGIMMVASSAATEGDHLLSPIGVMVAGRMLTPDILKQIRKATRLDISLIPLNQIKKSDAHLLTIFKKISNNKNGHTHQAINAHHLESFTLIRDINGAPIGMFRVVTPRIIYQSGLKSILFYSLSFILLGILFSLFMGWLLRILVIKRVELLEHDVSEIREKKVLSQRVVVKGNDELSSLSKHINSMMDTIQGSQEKLEQRVIKRTKKLKDTNVKLKQEISERKEVEKELMLHKEHLARLAHYDALTSLPNRVFFNEMLNKAIHHALRFNKLLAVLFIDLDRFKKINDALGHPAGDLVLQEFAHRFSSVLRQGDILARLGGDEFIILLNDVNKLDDAQEVAKQLLEISSKPIKIETQEFYLTASIGISLFPNDGLSLEDLQKHADIAMYKSKHAGGNIFHFYTKEMNLLAIEKIEWESALRKAIKKNELVLYYQPKLNLIDGKLAGLEALIRWDSPTLGIVSPSKFIPLAEETGLIIALGEWALYTACQTSKKWEAEGFQPIPIAVNLSAKQFAHQDIAKLVQKVLQKTKMNPENLELEITESAMMDNVEEAIEKLSLIKSMGVQISVDDFGTGYTSMSYLKQFPVSVLKIDQSFVRGIPDDQNDTAITSAVIALAHSLGIKVVAEGVETAEQLQFLADHQCDMVQGYYLSRPLPEAKIVLQFTMA